MVSILVPIYNVEDYLQRCIDSVRSQSFEDWELVLVDDGSMDGCPAICENAAREDARIRVVHKENGGLPSARLAGFMEAKGDWIVFLDADDWLLEGGLQILMDAATADGGYDIVKSRIRRVGNNGEVWDENYEINEGCLVGDEVFLKAIVRDLVSPYVHSGIYRRELFDEEIFRIIMRNGVSIGEDWFVNVGAGAKAKRVKIIDEATYAYFDNSASMMGSSVYGWEYYEKIENCKHDMNNFIGMEETEEYLSRKALMDLRYFFFPEVEFSWKHFKTIQPLALKGLEYQENERSTYNPKFVKFLKYPLLYWAYTFAYRYLFLIVKLRGRKRKVRS